MVVIHGWKSAPIGRSRLLKSIASLSKKLIAETGINLIYQTLASLSTAEFIEEISE